VSEKFILIVDTAPRTRKQTLYLGKRDDGYPYPRYETQAKVSYEKDAVERVTYLNARDTEDPPSDEAEKKFYYTSVVDRTTLRGITFGAHERRFDADVEQEYLASVLLFVQADERYFATVESKERKS